MEKKTSIAAMLVCDLIVLWQAYLAFVAYIKVPIFSDLMREYGGALPAITLHYFTFGPYFYIAPITLMIITGVLFVLKAKPVVWLAVIFLMFFISLGMQVLTVEGLTLPFQPICSEIC